MLSVLLYNLLNKNAINIKKLYLNLLFIYKLFSTIYIIIVLVLAKL